MAAGTRPPEAHPAQTAVMAPSERDIVTGYYAAVDAGDTASLLDMFHPEIEYRRGGYPPIRGRRELRVFYEEVRVIASGSHQVRSILVEGPDVAVRGSFTGLSHSGDHLTADWADFFTIDRGLIRLRDTYFMTAGV